MKIFSIVSNSYNLDVYISKIFIKDEKGLLIEKSGNFIVFVCDTCYEFKCFTELYDFILKEIDCLIDPLPF